VLVAKTHKRIDAVEPEPAAELEPATV
jgi:hypothetical protein